MEMQVMLPMLCYNANRCTICNRSIQLVSPLPSPKINLSQKKEKRNPGSLVLWGLPCVLALCMMQPTTVVGVAVCGHHVVSWLLLVVAWVFGFVRFTFSLIVLIDCADFSLLPSSLTLSLSFE